jgi:hypothetical protein
MCGVGHLFHGKIFFFLAEKSKNKHFLCKANVKIPAQVLGRLQRMCDVAPGGILQFRYMTISVCQMDLVF